MPEGPEVRRSVDWLREQLIGHECDVVDLGDSGFGGRYAEKCPKGYEGFRRDCWARTGFRVVDIGARGKFVWWELVAGPSTKWWLHCTYGMTGGWFRIASLDIKHVVCAVRRISLERDPPLTVGFLDQRHFGTLAFISDETVHVRKLKSLGPDVLAVDVDRDALALRLIARPSLTLAEVLMDQRVISGVGNYLKAEALWAARLSPHRKVLDLSADDLLRLVDCVVDCAQASYESGGATIATYRDPEGVVGEATQRFACYGRIIDADGNVVTRERTRDGRTTHWTPARQI
jgi:DNA-formamidopyrimidine glycosylase